MRSSYILSVDSDTLDQLSLAMDKMHHLAKDSGLSPMDALVLFSRFLGGFISMVYRDGEIEALYQVAAQEIRHGACQGFGYMEKNETWRGK